MRLLCLTSLVVILSLNAAEPYPLWDNHESVADYAKRAHLEPEKSIDLGGGVKLDLVLIPAGQFIMGSPEPVKPQLKVLDADWLIWLGSGVSGVLLLVLLIKCIGRRKFAFSLRWLLLMIIAAGLCVGGFTRRLMNHREAALHEIAMVQYATEMAEYKKLSANEKPAHSVTITQPFYMGKYTVTQAQYEQVMGNNPSNFKGPQNPVDSVSWDDATEFCRKVNVLHRSQSSNVCLPTEAQWEYACRAGTKTKFYSGDSDFDLNAVAWYSSNSSGQTHSVGGKKANDFRLYDMLGNVSQWCKDTYREDFEKLGDTDPLNNEPDDAHVLRGGSWEEESMDCRSARCISQKRDYRIYYIGFRVVVAISSGNP